MSRSFDRYASVVFLLIGIIFIVESRRFSSTSYGSGVGPDLFPTGLGIILILLSIRLFYETFHYPSDSNGKLKLDWKRFGIVLIAAIGYALSLEWIGYVLATFLFLLIGFQTMERGKWLSSVLISALFSYGVYYLYVNVLQGTLPAFPLF
ncbi:tripartite tricarboxylate transporter TctB family protein [Laceyella putida]|uniref:Tripartite tricarboxylate transporter TctB family protein n=1 Tax=Laceyella putida TaxID=110101 RepID=A0ABW2RJV1_9BACL